MAPHHPPASGPTPGIADAWHICRPTLIQAGFFGFAANLLVLAAPLYAEPIGNRLLDGQDAVGSPKLALIALGLFAVYALCGVARGHLLRRVDRQLGGDAAERPIVDGSLFDLFWIPLYLLALGWLHPGLCGMALAGAAALVALAAANELSMDWPPQSPASDRPDTAFPAVSSLEDNLLRVGLRFCAAIYQALVAGVGVLLVMRGDLSPGLAAGGILIGLKMLAMVQHMVGRWCELLDLRLIRRPDGAGPDGGGFPSSSQPTAGSAAR